MKKPKRILYITHYPDITGPEVSLINFLKHLNSKKYKPVVLCPYPGPFFNELKKLGFDVKIFPMIMAKKISSFIWFFKFSFFSIVTILKLMFLIKKENICLVHTNVSVNLNGAIAAKFLKVPNIIHVREIFSQGIQTKFYVWLLQKLADKIIAVSNAVKKQFQNNKAVVVYNGVDLSIFENLDCNKAKAKFNINEKDFVIGLIGRIHPQKGQKELINATSKLISKFPNLKLMIVGKYSAEEFNFFNKLKEMIKELNLSDKVIFTGYRLDIQDVISCFDVSCVPTIVPDSLPRVVIESMAASKPVIASNTGGIPEMLIDGKTGILVKPSDPESLANALCKIIRDKELAQKMGQNGRIYAENKFSIEKNVKEIEKIYEDLLLKKCQSKMEKE